MSSGQDYEEGYENLKTNGEGLIQSIRRRSYTTYSILSEIFGNLNGSIIYINYVKDKTILQVFVNDGGFNEKDLKCITEIYNSGENSKTASINGIGIRTSFDKMILSKATTSTIFMTPSSLISPNATYSSSFIIIFTSIMISTTFMIPSKFKSPNSSHVSLQHNPHSFTCSL